MNGEMNVETSKQRRATQSQARPNLKSEPKQTKGVANINKQSVTAPKFAKRAVDLACTSSSDLGHRWEPFTKYRHRNPISESPSAQESMFRTE